ncbi:hypothetical protein Taro_048632, partial [Colocasia esculenta]|nr:hypothetical protein [Colocasia esculenta]
IDGDETLVEETPWLREVGVVERQPVRTSRDVTSGRSSRPRHRQVLYFLHRRLWTMECSCKVWCKPCRRRLIPRQHSRHSWRPRRALEKELKHLSKEQIQKKPALEEHLKATQEQLKQGIAQ